MESINTSSNCQVSVFLVLDMSRRKNEYVTARALSSSCHAVSNCYPALMLSQHKAITAVTKRGTGTWDVGRGTWDAGTWGRGTRGRGNSGTWGLGDVVREDFETRRRAGIRGRDKQITPDFCAELVKYSFFEGQM